jgi:hypothetical protein
VENFPHPPLVVLSGIEAAPPLAVDAEDTADAAVNAGKSGRDADSKKEEQLLDLDAIANTGSGAGEKAGTLLSKKRMVDGAQEAILKDTPPPLAVGRHITAAGSDEQATGGALHATDEDADFDKKEVRIAASVV